jgi:hypothetical protein
VAAASKLSEKLQNSLSFICNHNGSSTTLTWLHRCLPSLKASHRTREYPRDIMTSTIGIPIKLLNEAQVRHVQTPPCLFAGSSRSCALTRKLLIVLFYRAMSLLSRSHLAKSIVANSSKVRPLKYIPDPTSLQRKTLMETHYS